MDTEPEEKKFDCVKWTREVRDRINEEIADMSFAELSQWLDRRVQEDPFFARIPTARKPARPPTARATARGAGSSGARTGDGT